MKSKKTKISQNTAPKQPPKETGQTAEDFAVALAQALIRIPSITPLKSEYLPAARESLDLIEEIAQQTSAQTKRLSFAGGHEKWDYEVDNLYVEWVFGTPDKHICYLGHTDVVPPGDHQKWGHDPFSGLIEDGYLHGRGATDMKGSVAAFVAAMHALAKDPKSQNLNMRIGVVLTTDEEWAAINGTRKVLEALKKDGKKPDSFIVGEPSSHDHLASHIKLGRRGSLVGTLSIDGVQGHAAYTSLFENPNRAMGLAILNSQKWEDGTDFTPNTNFEIVATHSGDFKSSAIIPGKADVLWNIRFTTQQSPKDLEKKIEDCLRNPPKWAQDHPDVGYLSMIRVKANIDTASTPYQSRDGHMAQAISEAISNITGQAPVKDGSGGTTDGRFIHTYFPDADIVELGLPERGGITCRHKKPDDYLQNGGMHQINERASIKDIRKLTSIFKEAVTRYARNTPKPTPQQKQTKRHHPSHRRKGPPAG